MDDILNDYVLMQSDILCFQETHMELCMQNKQFPNNNCISSYITHGVMIPVKKHVPILDHIHIEEKNVELVLANFFSHGTEVAILNLYDAPHATFSNIVNVISNALDHFHVNRSIVLVGDFDIDMLQNTGRTKELQNYM
jgi:exonuclease III